MNEHETLNWNDKDIRNQFETKWMHKKQSRASTEVTKKGNEQKLNKKLT